MSYECANNRNIHRSLYVELTLSEDTREDFLWVDNFWVGLKE